MIKAAKGVFDVQKILFIVSIILTAAFLFLGYQSWQGKLEEVHEVRPAAVADVTEEEPAEETDLEMVEEDSALPAANLPEDTQEMLNSHLASGKPVKVVLAATESAAIAEPNWATALEAAMTEQYAPLTLEFETFSYNETSDYWADNLSEDDRFTDADLIVFEASTIYDNGLWSIDDQLFFLNQMVDAFNTSYPEADVFVLPSQPLADAAIYTEQAEAVKAAIEGSEIEYIDHWSEWPAGAELSALLDEENDPTEEGRTLWGEQIVNYFVSSDQQ